MGPEINVDSILVLEKQISEGTGDVIKLKRARNSLLNISTRVPPEILGYIFRWNVIPSSPYGGLQKGSYNFLLVCHHWFQVASCTPELWSSWGNKLEQWSLRCKRSGTAPVDLTLNEYRDSNLSFDGTILDVLRGRAVRDSIRSIHLDIWDTDLLRSIIASLTLDGEDIRYSSIESVMLENPDLDISNFLVRYRFPKLWRLHLTTNIKTPTWGHLKLYATALTTLSLAIEGASPILTTPELFSILASFPMLQDLSLRGATIPRDTSDGSTLRVHLHYLKRLDLTGDCRRVFQLLRRLEYPDRLDVSLRLRECEPEGISEFFEPYLQDRIRRDDRFKGRLGTQVKSMFGSISFGVDFVDEFDILADSKLIESGHTSMTFITQFRDTLPQGAKERYFINLIALVPREHLVYLTWISPVDPRGLLFTMPNLERLYLMLSVVSDMFLQPDSLAHTKLFPSLRHLSMMYFDLQNGDWGSLLKSLAHLTSGGQAISLRLFGYPPIPPAVMEEIESLVELRLE